jgi:hypothetical protein
VVSRLSQVTPSQSPWASFQLAHQFVPSSKCSRGIEQDRSLGSGQVPHPPPDPGAGAPGAVAPGACVLKVLLRAGLHRGVAFALA